jgi:hypothetical protein
MSMRFVGAGLVFAAVAMMATPAAALNIRVPRVAVAAIPAPAEHPSAPMIMPLEVRPGAFRAQSGYLVCYRTDTTAVVPIAV